jgi:hypothetical protein
MNNLNIVPNARLQFDSSSSCELAISATTEIGPNAGSSYNGSVVFSVAPHGAIDLANYQDGNGVTYPVVGQVNGRSIRFRIELGPEAHLSLFGLSLQPSDPCGSDISGSFAGPELQDVGTWSAQASGNKS